jgi:hypothetical protein
MSKPVPVDVEDYGSHDYRPGDDALGRLSRTDLRQAVRRSQ